MRLLLDINILLDVLAARQAFVKESAAVMSLVEAGVAEGLVAAHSMTTLHYLLGKHIGRTRATAALIDLSNLVEIVAVDHETILQALALGWADFEDAVQAICALRGQATHLITRNTKGFKLSSVPVLEPFELLAYLDSARP